MKQLTLPRKGFLNRTILFDSNWETRKRHFFRTPFDKMKRVCMVIRYFLSSSENEPNPSRKSDLPRFPVFGEGFYFHAGKSQFRTPFFSRSLLQNSLTRAKIYNPHFVLCSIWLCPLLVPLRVTSRVGTRSGISGKLMFNLTDQTIPLCLQPSVPYGSSEMVP